MIPPPPSSTLFPYTTLFRSDAELGDERAPQMPARDSDLRRESLESVFVERSVLDHIDGGLTETRRRIDARVARRKRSEEHTSELQSHVNLVCRLLLEKKNKT